MSGTDSSDRTNISSRHFPVPTDDLMPNISRPSVDDFGRWIDDLCNRTYDQEWLVYQEEIGVRHHPVGKNRTDGVQSTSAYIPMRHLIAFVVPVTLTIREFLADGGKATSAEVDAMYQAWFKAVTLTVALWVRPYNSELW